MGWLDHQEQLKTSKPQENNEQIQQLEIHMPNAPENTYVPLSKYQINRKYEDEVGARLVIIIDEVAELLQPSGVKTEAGKEEDALKQEIVGLIQSITQLGRSGGIHCILATQRNDASIIPGVIQSNDLSVDTKVNIGKPE